MKLISLGKIDEKFLLYSYVYIIIKVLSNSISFFLEDSVSTKNIPLILIINNSANIFFGIPEYFIRKAFPNKTVEEKEDIKKNIDNNITYIFIHPKKESNIKSIIILIFVILLNYIYIWSKFAFQKDILNKDYLIYTENLKCINLFFIFFMQKIFDKKLFYRHQYISLVIMVI